jgi:hypothetical protein
MLFLTRWFGVTVSEEERNLGAEHACIEEIVRKALLLQSNAAAQQHRSLGRGTHAKGTCARAQFEVFDVSARGDAKLAARLARGIFAAPGVYPAIVRFGNADPKMNSDFRPDVRSLSFAVDLTRGGTTIAAAGVERQDFSLQNTTTLPINDARAFLAVMNLLTAANPATGLWSLPFKDKLRTVRSLALAQMQMLQKIGPYQKLRYGSNVPFRHGPAEVVKYSATPSPDNPSRPLQRGNPNALQEELARHLEQDSTMSSFEFGVQFLDPDRMTYWGKRLDADFWIENASVEWNQAKAPFHPVARLTLEPRSRLSPEESLAVYFDVTGNATLDSTPVGSINRARWRAEVASRQARIHIGAATKPNQ